MRSFPLAKVIVQSKGFVHQLLFAMSPHPNPAIVGGLGSGKTRAGIMRTMRLKFQYPYANIAYYMPTYGLLADRAIPGIEAELIALNQPYKYNLKSNKIIIDGKGEIWFRSMDNPKTIIAYEVAHSIVDELDTLKPKKAKEIYQKITERNRQPLLDGSSNSIGIITTPDNGTNGIVFELYKQCIDMDSFTEDGDYNLIEGGVVEGFHLIEANTRDNTFNPPDYYDKLLKLYDPISASIYTRGKMVSLSRDKIYHYYNKIKHHTNKTIYDFDELHIGIDFNIGGCACVVCGLDGENIYVLESFAPQNTDAIVIEINARYQGKVITIYPDSSGKSERTNASHSDIAILENSIRTPSEAYFDYPPVNGAVRDRENAVNAKLSKFELRVDYLNNPKVANALQSQGRDELGRPEKSNDHNGGAVDDWNDALGYLVVRLFPVDGRKLLQDIKISRY